MLLKIVIFLVLGFTKYKIIIKIYCNLQQCLDVKDSSITSLLLQAPGCVPIMSKNPPLSYQSLNTESNIL